MVASSRQTIEIETIVADVTTLNFLEENSALSLRLQFAKPDTEHDMCVQKDPPSDSKTEPPQVTATTLSPTAFREGMAYSRTSLPWCGRASARDLQPPGHPHSLHWEGRLQRDISRAATGWKSALFKPLTPSFATTTQAHRPVAVTGTAKHPANSAESAV